MEASADLGALMRRGFALNDILTELSRIVTDIEFPPDALRLLMERLADVEHRLAFGTSERLQGAAVVGAFIAARDVMDVAARRTGAGAGARR